MFSEAYLYVKQLLENNPNELKLKDFAWIDK